MSSLESVDLVYSLAFWMLRSISRDSCHHLPLLLGFADLSSLSIAVT